MQLNNVVRGQPTTATTVFIDQDVLVFKDSPTWTVLDYENNQVINGIAFQNIDHPEQWIATFTLPEDCPVQPDSKYSLIWRATVNGKQYQNTDTFTVLLDGEAPIFDSSSIMMSSDLFSDMIILSDGCSNFSITLTDENGTLLHSDSDPAHFTTRKLNNSTIVDYNAGVVIPKIQKQVVNIGSYPFVVTWKYSSPTNPINTEFHMVYVCTTKTVMYVAALKRVMDKARNYDINPNLRFTDQELCCFLLLGLARINSAPPILTGWSLQQLPKYLEYMLLKCAEYEALSAWALAEGMSAFNFTGASTSLEVDRTGHIREKMNEAGKYIDENLSKIKDNLVRTSSAGVLSVAITPSTNSSVRLTSSWMLTRLFRTQFLV